MQLNILEYSNTVFGQISNQHATSSEIASYWTEAVCKYRQSLVVTVTHGPFCSNFGVELETCNNQDYEIVDGDILISLEELKAKQGVSGNYCLERIREIHYEFAKKRGYLRDLCNGLFDPRC